MKRHAMEYDESSREQLLQRIQELEEVTNQLEQEKNDTELESFPWIGNLGHWYWMVQSNELVFNEKKATNLGFTREEIPEQVGYQYFTDKLHPDDYDRVMDNMRKNLMGETGTYEVEYRIRTKAGDYTWYYDRGAVTKRGEGGTPIVVAGIVFDISRNKAMECELKEANKRLKYLVNTDELTGAYNKRFMIKKVSEEIERCQRTKNAFSLIMLDVDDFKSINDTYGHNMGDSVLKKFVERIDSRIRKTDFLCRWGGDEFIVLLPDTDLDGAVELAQDIKEEFAANEFDTVGELTSSIGVSSYSEGDTLDTLIKKVDDLMYTSKKAGKSRVSY